MQPRLRPERQSDLGRAPLSSPQTPIAKFISFPRVLGQNQVKDLVVSPGPPGQWPKQEGDRRGVKEPSLQSHL